MSRPRVRHTTVPRSTPPAQPKKPPAPRPVRRGSAPAASAVAQIIDRSDTSLLDVIDNLLNQGVVLNADIVLALANVDLVFMRLAAILCAADRLFPPYERPTKPSR